MSVMTFILWLASVVVIGIAADSLGGTPAVVLALSACIFVSCLVSMLTDLGEDS